MIGELIFALPFHVTRFFRPTVLEVFEFTNFELGAMFSAYGVTAMVAYLPGGAIADRFSPRRLMAISAFTTALGGVYMVTIPSVMGMTLLYGYWGVTSILLFWAALIRSTRAAGGASEQGQVFGLLDAGRGLVAAGVASGVVWLYSSLLPVDAAAATVAERTLGLQWVIWSYTGLTVFAGLLVWFFIPEEEGEGRSSSDAFNPARIRQVLAMPTVWLIALIVICAYCGFKAIDNYAVFVVDAYGMTDVEGAQLSTWAAWIRPVSALVIGIGSDRLSTGKSTAWCFGILACSYLGFVLHEPIPGKTAILYITIFISAVVIYGLRALYFALMETSKGAYCHDGDCSRRHLFSGLHTGYIFDANGWLAHRPFTGSPRSSGLFYIDARNRTAWFRGGPRAQSTDESRRPSWSRIPTSYALPR